MGNIAKKWCQGWGARKKNIKGEKDVGHIGRLSSEGGGLNLLHIFKKTYAYDNTLPSKNIINLSNTYDELLAWKKMFSLTCKSAQPMQKISRGA